MFWSKSDSSIKIELKTWFLDIRFFPKYDYPKSLVFEICRNEKFPIQNLTFWNFFFSNFHCAGKTFASESDYFFLKISIQTLIFNEKVCYKVMPFKMSTQSEKLVVGHGANPVKTLFLRPDVFIEIWFLDINWTENLTIRKNFVSTKRFFEKFFIEIRQDKKLSILKLIKL